MIRVPSCATSCARQCESFDRLVHGDDAARQALGVRRRQARPCDPRHARAARLEHDHRPAERQPVYLA